MKKITITKIIAAIALVFASVPARADIIEIASLSYPPYATEDQGLFNEIFRTYNEDKNINGGIYELKLTIVPHKRLSLIHI